MPRQAAKWKGFSADEPNVILPLATSYNERGPNGYVASITNGIDQRKVNCFYEPIQNSQTGKTTLYLRKRIGIIAGTALAVTVTTYRPYLMETQPDNGTLPWVIGLSGISTVATNSVASTNVLASTNMWPGFVDSTVISGIQHVVLQIVYDSPSGSDRTFYASTLSGFTEIGDANYSTFIHRGKMEHMDGYGFQMVSSNRIHNSHLNTLSSWPLTNYITKSIEQDYAAGLARLGRTILSFGIETVEGFYNAGNPVGSPLGRIPGMSARYGLGYASISKGSGNISARHYYTTIGKVMYFLGTESQPYKTDTSGSGLYAFDGSQFGKVSTPAIDRILSRPTGTGVVYNVCKMQVAGDLAVAIALTAPNAATQVWLIYMPRLKEWFEWNSTAVQPVSNGHFVAGIGGTSNSVKYHIPTVTGNWTDGSGASYTLSYQFKLPRSGSQTKRMQMAGLIADTSSTVSVAQMAVSRDDYASFEADRDIDMQKVRKEIFRLGAYRDLSIRISHSSNADFRAESFIARVE